MDLKYAWYKGCAQYPLTVITYLIHNVFQMFRHPGKPNYHDRESFVRKYVQCFKLGCSEYTSSYLLPLPPFRLVEIVVLSVSRSLWVPRQTRVKTSWVRVRRTWMRTLREEAGWRQRLKGQRWEGPVFMYQSFVGSEVICLDISYLILHC